MTTARRVCRLHRRQAEFHQSPAPYRAFCGGRGAGKSYVGATDLLLRARPGRTYLVGSPTGVMLNDTTLPTFKKNAQELALWDESGVRYTPYPTVTLRSGATVRFRTADNPERMRGPNLSGVWLDEASLMPRDAYDICIAALREGGEQGWLSATFTPKGPSHWSYEVFATDRPGTHLVRARTGDNPFIPADFESTLQTQYGDTQFARQELLGEFVQVEGAEFPFEMFDYPGFWFDKLPTTGIVGRVVYLDPSKGRTDQPGDYQAFALAVHVQETQPDQPHRPPANHVYLDAQLNRETPPQMVERAVRLVREWGPVNVFAFEDNGTMGLLGQLMRDAFDRAGLLVPLLPVVNTDPKLYRMRVYHHYLSLRTLHVRNSAGGRMLRAQLGDLPWTDHDDGPDAGAGALRLLAELSMGRR